MFLYKSVIYVSLLGLFLGGCSSSMYSSSDWQYSDPAAPQYIVPAEYLTSQLIKSCGKDVEEQLHASEAVMELIVRGGVDPATGRMRKDLDENLYTAGVNLYVLNLSIIESTLSIAECRDITMLIQRDLLIATARS